MGGSCAPFWVSSFVSSLPTTFVCSPTLRIATLCREKLMVAMMCAMSSLFGVVVLSRRVFSCG